MEIGQCCRARLCLPSPSPEPVVQRLTTHQRNHLKCDERASEILILVGPEGPAKGLSLQIPTEVEMEAQGPPRKSVALQTLSPGSPAPWD